MELTRDCIEWLANQPHITKMSQVETDELICLAKMLLAEMDKPKVWDGAPDNAGFASVNFCKESGIPLQFGKTMFYTRTLPKSPEREIAEKYSCDTETCHPMINGRRAVDVIESAINEYKEREKS